MAGKWQANFTCQHVYCAQMAFLGQLLSTNTRKYVILIIRGQSDDARFFLCRNNALVSPLSSPTEYQNLNTVRTKHTARFRYRRRRSSTDHLTSIRPNRVTYFYPRVAFAAVLPVF